jgi:protein-tyrosine phosphatase
MATCPAGQLSVADFIPQMSDLSTSRTLPATGIHNFRDSGGYRVGEGRRLAQGLLYRSAEHTTATDADLKIVDTLRLAAIVDLRGTAERLAAPSRRPFGFSVPVYVVDGETALDATGNEQALAHVDAAGARAGTLQRYVTMPFRPMLVAALRLYFQTLAYATGSVLVSCTAGKDRTGVAVALLHSTLGVHFDDILSDYLLTNSAGDSNARLAALRPDLERRYGGTMDEEAVRVAASVHEEYLNASLTVIRERYGSIDAYVTRALGVTDAMRAALLARLAP